MNSPLPSVSETPAKKRTLVPRDAATLIVVDRSSDAAAVKEPRILMGHRSGKHVFMPNTFVFPGGRLDPGEDAITAALREMAEEIGVRRPPDAVMGVLDDYVTHSGYRMTPVVVWAGAAVEAVANPGEVDKIFRIPLADAMTDAFVEMIPVEGHEHPMIRLHLGDRHMHAPTAAVVYQFREVALFGRMTRAAHLLAPGWTAR